METVLDVFQPQQTYSGATGEYVDITPAADETPPDQLIGLTQVRLDSSDFESTRSQYQSAWNLFFVDKDWYKEGAAKATLPKILPCFALLNLNPGAFGLRLVDEQNTEAIRNLMGTSYLALPFKRVKSAGSNDAKVQFMGVRLNDFYAGTTSGEYYFNQDRVEIVELCVYGYYLPHEALQTAFATSLPLAALTSGQRNYLGRSVMGRITGAPQGSIPQNERESVMRVAYECEAILSDMMKGV